MPAKLLIVAMGDTDKVTEWNTTLTEARVLKNLNNDCAISYQVKWQKQVEMFYLNTNEQLFLFV